MDKKNKIFFLMLFLLIAGSIAFTYWRIMIKKDYVIESQTDCDPTVDKCFIWKCDPSATDESEKCTGDSEKDTWYYQLSRRNAGKIPLCDPDKDENCLPMECDPSVEKDCSTIFCDDKNKIEQKAECSDPQEYLKNNPPEESAKCEDGDVQCGIDNAEEAPDNEVTNDNIETTPTGETNLPDGSLKCENGSGGCPIPTTEEKKCAKGDTKCLNQATGVVPEMQ